MHKIHFQEIQKFNQPWIIIMLLSSFFFTLAVVLVSSYSSEKTGESIAGSNESIIGISILVVTFSFVFWLIMNIKLEVKVTDEAIIYRFKPLMLKEKTIIRKSIARYEVRKYNPIRDYGGYGLRTGWKWGRAFNVSGNMGMQLYMESGKKILFGTQRPDAFKYAMDKMMGIN